MFPFVRRARYLAACGVLLIAGVHVSARAGASGAAGSTRVLTAVVAPADAGPLAADPGALRFQDLREAFNALHDSAQAGYDAERYQLLIAPGLYRLRKPLSWIEPDESRGDHELEIAALPGARVIVSGAETCREGDPVQPWNDMKRWTTDHSALHRYTTEWPYLFGLADLSDFDDRYIRWIENTDQPELMKRREMVLINGTILKQVLKAGALQPGTFYVEEGNERDPGRLTVQLDAPLLPDDQIEIPVAESLLILRNFDRVQIRGIDFIRANPHHAQTAVILSGIQSARIEDCGFNENNWRGLSVSRTPLPTDRQRPDSLEIVNCRANGNGGMGMGLSNLARLRVEGCELAWNNWRGRQAGTTDWAVAGSKIFHGHDVSVIGLKAHDNLATGLWFDTDAMRVHIENCDFQANASDGLFLEASQGPIEVMRCNFSDNARNGLRNNSSDNITVRDCRFSHNVRGQFGLAATSRKFENFENGKPMHVRGTKDLFVNNVFVGDPIWMVETWLSPKAKNWWVGQTSFRGNKCWPFDRSNPFCQEAAPADPR